MSLNVENLFVKDDDPKKACAVVRAYWSQDGTQQPDWGIPSSYDQLLRNNPKRKLAVSAARDGWIALVESKEVVDFGMAKALSEQLNTAVLAIQVSEATGAAGYASAVGGKLLESSFRDDDDNPLESVRNVMRKYRVPFDPIMFRKAAQNAPEGWTICAK